MFHLFVWTSTWCLIVYIISFCDVCAVDRNISYYRGGTVFEASEADMPSGNLKLWELGFTAKIWKHWITWIVKSACFVSVAAQVIVMAIMLILIIVADRLMASSSTTLMASSSTTSGSLILRIMHFLWYNGMHFSWIKGSQLVCICADVCLWRSFSWIVVQEFCFCCLIFVRCAVLLWCGMMQDSWSSTTFSCQALWGMLC